MNRLIFVSMALCLLLAPALSLPAEKQSEKLEDFAGETPAKHPNENEVNGSIDRDTEQVGSSESGVESERDPETEFDGNTNIAVSSVNGQIQGVIERVGYKGDFHCRKITCPPGTQKCTYGSKFSGNGKTLEVNYKCTDKNGTLLSEKTQTESIDEATNFQFPDISVMFKRMEDFMKNMFSGPFWGVDKSIEDDAE